MAFLLIRHRVEDFATWKSEFDAHARQRGPAGSRGGFLFRSAEDPNEVVILLEWENLQKARDFAASEDLRAAMSRSGVSDQPDVYFLEEVDRPAA